MDDLDDDNVESLGDMGVATAADLNAELIRHTGILGRVNAGVQEYDRSAKWIQEVSVLHADAVAVFESDRPLHDALIDLAWVKRRVA